MNEPSYPFKRIEDRLTFSFESVSQEKTIQKLVEFRLFDDLNELYNLALIDILPDGTVSDLTVSNNQDMPKVLATVFQSIRLFFQTKPKAKILIQGSTASRTRLYQIAIVKYYNELEPIYNIWGFRGNNIQVFETGYNFEGFIVSFKNYEKS
jgi:hypothetical protein